MIQYETTRDLVEHLKQERIMQELSQAKLAEMCGLKQQYIGAIEKGIRIPTLDTLQTIASALGKRVTLSLD